VMLHLAHLDQLGNQNAQTMVSRTAQIYTPELSLFNVNWPDRWHNTWVCVSNMGVIP